MTSNTVLFTGLLNLTGKQGKGSSDLHPWNCILRSELQGDFTAPDSCSLVTILTMCRVFVLVYHPSDYPACYTVTLLHCLGPTAPKSLESPLPLSRLHYFLPRLPISFIWSPLITLCPSLINSPKQQEWSFRNTSLIKSFLSIFKGFSVF